MFKDLDLNTLNENTFDLIFKKWMLVTAQKKDGSINTLTASWGGLGIAWNIKTATLYIRPHRYTMEFIEEAESFSLSFLPKNYRKELNYLGSVSGREEDKIPKSKLTVSNYKGVPYFEEACLVMFCEKKFISRMLESDFVDKSLVGKHYPQKDFHNIVIGEITKAIMKEDA